MDTYKFQISGTEIEIEAESESDAMEQLKDIITMLSLMFPGDCTEIGEE
ncbi:hypothetical protein [Gloeocapsopsis sp. IPPAS B-1203]|nr:hypothetical protein [Gloeocapsopsis sp. IPPAS B-1203]